MSPANYVTTTKTLTGGWDAVCGRDDARTILIIADAAGVGMLWTTSPTPTANEGVPFSDAGAKGSWVFSDPSIRSPVLVKGPAGAVCTVVSA